MSTSFRAPFVGVGTGRCGTTSLDRIVNACSNTRVTHEAYQMYWYEVNSRVGDLIRDMREGGSTGVLVGESSQACGPHVSNLRSAFSGLKVVCLHRDQESTVESFMNSLPPMLRPGDKMKWIDGAMGDTTQARASKCFPLIDANNARQACGFYWEMYESLMSQITDPVFHIGVEELNDDSRLSEMFEFLGIPADDIVFLEKRKFFTSEDAEDRKKELIRGTSGKPR